MSLVDKVDKSGRIRLPFVVRVPQWGFNLSAHVVDGVSSTKCSSVSTRRLLKSGRSRGGKQWELALTICVESISMRLRGSGSCIRSASHTLSARPPKSISASSEALGLVYLDSESSTDSVVCVVGDDMRASRCRAVLSAAQAFSHLSEPTYPVQKVYHTTRNEHTSKVVKE